MVDRRKPQEILDQIVHARTALEELIYGMDEARQIKADAVGKWTVKDVMAHIGRWEEVCYEIVYDYVHNSKKPTEDYSQFLAYNDKWEPEFQAMSLQESIHLFESAHARLFGLLSSLREDQWGGYVGAWVPGSTFEHFEEHVKDLQALQS